MRLTRTGWLGLILIAVGLVPLALWNVWFRTRSWLPVDIPISLSQGNHFSTGEFAINLEGRYEISVNATAKNTTLDTLGSCLAMASGLAPCPQW